MGKVKKKRRSNGDGKRIFRSPKGVHHVCRKKALAAPLFLTTSCVLARACEHAAWEAICWTLSLFFQEYYYYY